MAISIAVLLLACVSFASTSASAQSKTQTSESIRGSTGLFGGSLSVVDETDAMLGGWLDIAFREWKLGTLELEIARTGQQDRRDEFCPYDDCTARYEKDAKGEVKLINDPNKTPAPGIRLERHRTFSVAALRHFRASQHATPHFLVGIGTLLRQTSFAFDDPEFGDQRWRRKAWGPVAGVGVDFSVTRLVARLQYRVDPMFLGKECILICNKQLRIGVGWKF